ncbi:hypothetical protein [Bradyrhizobium sp. SZCCHNR1098]|uniref:hypothetical protein n=1 Tax=Bradyrhizobium sp. SZCCHNR1098 TaxID=3057370 RepID=UPI002915CACA|nr:hypothetical protein [Bradyrhizobium sp. SZCCHNR1098]
MTLTFKSTALDVITHDYGRAKYTATREGSNWVVTGHNEAGEPVRKQINWCPNRFDAAAHMLQFAMEQHDETKRARPSPRVDRVVNVYDDGAVGAAPIVPRRWP